MPPGWTCGGHYFLFDDNLHSTSFLMSPLNQYMDGVKGQAP